MSGRVTKTTRTLRGSNTNTKTIASNGMDQGESIKIQQLFKLMVENGASDLHLSVGTPPGMRINGEIIRVKTSPLTASMILS